MEAFGDVKGKEVLSNDGRYVGKLLDFTYGEGYRTDDIFVKVNKEVIDDLGEDKPLLKSLKLGISVEQIKAFTDKIILEKDLDALHIHVEDVSEKKMISSLLGLELSGSEGNDVGKVEDILIDTRSFGVFSLLVKTKKEIVDTLDLEKSMLSKTRLGISMTHVTNIGDRIMLDASIEGMGRIIEEEPIKKV